MRAEDTVLILLAAGRSQRFGDADKLAQEFLHKPVAYHVVTALEAIPFLGRIAVIDGTKLDFASRGYDVIVNDDPAAGMSRSVQLGARAARAMGARGVVIALADMPRITAAHVYRLLDTARDDADAVVASSDGTKPCPPAVFGAGRFDFLETLEGDAGARDLVRAGRHVVTTPAELIDIDTPEDLDRLRSIAEDPAHHDAITLPQAEPWWHAKPA
ncbi:MULTISPECIES: nucleotidyltransferase family protein [unclassified Sphingomonas]|uniref:nucleotidyltransferase family protein n=1 Tax=unclassified Sphingomonas TaxID=196159 RepID=UPI0006FCE874|nr:MULTISPECIES: nucleotidyltransferase family protein [unclassified Sphingomonas]KQM24672.1 MobA [Sphingomonas sp. Leaf9]KQM42330.1 MobA [Sphingomonas sp. Leaf11]